MITSDQILSICTALSIGTIGPLLIKAFITRKQDKAGASKIQAEADTSIVDGAMIVIESLQKEIKRLSERVEFLNKEVTESGHRNRELQKAFSTRMQRLEAQRAALQRSFTDLEKKHVVVVFERDTLLSQLKAQEKPPISGG